MFFYNYGVDCIIKHHMLGSITKIRLHKLSKAATTSCWNCYLHNNACRNY